MDYKTTVTIDRVKTGQHKEAQKFKPGECLITTKGAICMAMSYGRTKFISAVELETGDMVFLSLSEKCRPVKCEIKIIYQE